MTRFLVTVARDLSEYADLIVEADDRDEAEYQVRQAIDANTLPPLKWREGMDREGLDVIDSEPLDGQPEATDAAVLEAR